jgi:hypothetical protein
MNAWTDNPFLLEAITYMSQSRAEIYADLAVCTGIFILGWEHSTPSIAIAAMAFVQSIKVADMMRAYRSAKNE